MDERRKPTCGPWSVVRGPWSLAGIFPLIVLFVGLGAGCAGRPVLGGARPAWVSHKPELPSLYQGVGASEQDWGQADERALADLAVELRVRVWSMMKDTARETTTGDRTETVEAFSAETLTLVNETLEGARIIERWRDPATGEYWAYAVLEKATVRRQVERRVEDARWVALDHYASAAQARERGEIAIALKSYIDALMALQTVVGRPIEADVDGDGAPDVLSNEVERGLEQTLGAMAFVPRSDRVVMRGGQPPDDPLAIQAVYSASSREEIAAPGIPVRFAFLQGAGRIHEQSLTDTDGEARSRVYEIAPGETECEVEARLDLRALIGSDHTTDETARAVCARLEILGAPAARFRISVVPRRVAVRIEERNLGQVTNPSFLEGALFRGLLDAGFVLVPEEEIETVLEADDVERLIRHDDLSSVGRVGKQTQADLLIAGEASSEYSQTQFGVISCWATAVVRVVDVQRLRVVASADVHRVKGFDDDRRDQAGERALDEAASIVSGRILEQLTDPR